MTVGAGAVPRAEGAPRGDSANRGGDQRARGLIDEQPATYRDSQGTVSPRRQSFQRHT